MLVGLLALLLVSSASLVSDNVPLYSVQICTGREGYRGAHPHPVGHWYHPSLSPRASNPWVHTLALTVMWSHARVLNMERPLCKYCQKNVSKRKRSSAGTIYFAGPCSTCRRKRNRAGEYAYEAPSFPISQLPDGPLKEERIRIRAILGKGGNKGQRQKTYRRHLKTVCEQCGFVPQDYCQLDAHHKDGNRQNNTAENIETLCANCHRLEHVTVPRPVPGLRDGGSSNV